MGQKQLWKEVVIFCFRVESTVCRGRRNLRRLLTPCLHLENSTEIESRGLAKRPQDPPSVTHFSQQGSPLRPAPVWEPGVKHMNISHSNHNTDFYKGAPTAIDQGALPRCLQHKKRPKSALLMISRTIFSPCLLAHGPLSHRLFPGSASLLRQDLSSLPASPWISPPKVCRILEDWFGNGERFTLCLLATAPYSTVVSLALEEKRGLLLLLDRPSKVMGSNSLVTPCTSASPSCQLPSAFLTQLLTVTVTSCAP